MNRNANVYVWVFIVIVLALFAWMLVKYMQDTDGQIEDTTPPVSEDVPTYPTDFGLRYVTPVDWPPVTTTLAEGTYTCTSAGGETERAGKTEEVLIHGKTYCKTTLSEGAAGSVYFQYAYIFEENDTLQSVTFSARMPQCANYDELERAFCVEEQETFNPDLFVALMAGM